MRIINRKEFLNLPTPFMYVECDEHGNAVGDLSINCGNIKNVDWVYNSCTFQPDFKNSNELFNGIDNMMANSSLDIPVIDMNTSRDGFFNQEQLFIVFSKEDFKLFTKTMNKYLDVYGENKDIKYEDNN